MEKRRRSSSNGRGRILGAGLARSAFGSDLHWGRCIPAEQFFRRYYSRKDIEYPFVSMQIASAVAQVSGLVGIGAATELLPCPSTPLTELREHSIVLLGGYNNQWAMRLLQSQRIRFTPEPVEAIVDRMQPQSHWSRDRSLPYSSADDYALIARFRDTTTDGWVVVLAGLGRNRSEAADNPGRPHICNVREQMGRDFSSRSVEVVLKVRVIDGKTGRPRPLPSIPGSRGAMNLPTQSSGSRIG